MGHLIRIGNYVTDLKKQGKNSSKINELFLNFPEELQQKWEDFVENKLVVANRNNEITLVTVINQWLDLACFNLIKCHCFYQSKMVVPRISSDEEEPEVNRHAIHKDTALQEVNQHNLNK